MFDLSAKQTLAWQALENKEATSITEDGRAVAINHVFYGGAAGGGKSWLGCVWQMYRRLNFPGTWGAICKDTKTNMEDSIIPTMLRVLESAGLQIGVHFRFRSGNNTRITFQNDSVILFQNLDYKPSDPDYHKLGGKEITDLFIDEAQTVPRKAFEIMFSRIRYRNEEYGLPYSVLLTGNPGPHWLRDKYYKDIDGNPVKLGEHETFIQAFLQDNPDQDFVRGYMRSLAKLPDYEKARLLYGDWDAEPRTGAEFYSSFTPARDVVDAPVYDPEQPLHLTWDFNVHPYLTCCIWQMKGKEAVQIGEICARHPRSKIKVVCQDIVARYGGHQSTVYIYGDPSGKQEDTRSEQGYNDFTFISDGLRSFQTRMRIGSKAPAVAMRGRFINALFEGQVPGCSVKIGGSCRESIRDYQNVKEGADGNKEKKKVRDPDTGISYEPLGHTSDANDYFLCWVYRAEFERFKNGGSTVRHKAARRSSYSSRRY